VLILTGSALPISLTNRKEAQASRCKVNDTAADDALHDITGMLLDVGSPYTHDRDMLVSSQRRIGRGKRREFQETILGLLCKHNPVM
jgi:hypothetical protein